MFSFSHIFFISLFFIPSFCLALTSQSTVTRDGPWFTGPLLTSSGTVNPYGHFNIEPYVYHTFYHGAYDTHGNIIPTKKLKETLTQLQVRIGLPSIFDCGFNLNTFFKERDGASAVAFGDTFISSSMQLVKAPPHVSSPNIKIAVTQSFPTGKYKNLDPYKKGCDSGGNGSFGTRLGLNMSQLFHLYKVHFINARASLSATSYTPVKIHGFSSYGGNASTRGKIYKGFEYNFLSAFELSLTKNLAFACDFKAVFQNKSHFHGQSSNNLNRPSSTQLSLAPALEYNFSHTHGIIAGSWFTLTGRNSNKFGSTVIAYNYYY